MVTQDNHRVNKDDLRLAQDDPLVTQDDARVTQDDPRVTQDDPMGHLKIVQPMWALSGLLKGHRGSFWDHWSC